MKYNYKYIYCLLLCCLGCQSQSSAPQVSYAEWGTSFIPAVKQFYEQGKTEPKSLQAITVFWGLSGYIPTATEADKVANVVCLCEGEYASGEALWSLVNINLREHSEEDVWELAHRVVIGNQPGFLGRKDFEQQPTLAEFEAFILRAQLEKQISYHSQRLNARKNSPPEYYLRSKIYERECRDYFNTIPDVLQKLAVDLPTSEKSKQ
jgi:hypothetical protein